MKRWEGESFDAYRARRAETNAIEKAYLQGRVNGRYVDPVLHSMLKRDANRKKRMRVLIMVLLFTGMLIVAGWILAEVLTWLIGI